MPGAIAHYLCGKEILRLLNPEPFRELIGICRQVFNLGTQGPDIFFYYRVWPWTKSGGVEKIGARLHEENVGAFFSQALTYIINQEDRERKLLTAYLCGYLAHYALDLHTHPYILFRTGFVRPGENPTRKYDCYHRMFETSLDVLMLNRLEGKRPAQERIDRMIRVSEKDARMVGGMYQFVLKQIYGANLAALQVARAIQDMAGVQAILGDRFGLKKKLLSRIEQSLGRDPLVSSMIYPPVVSDGLDYLNLAQRTWFFPWDRSGPKTLSFPQLFAAAVREGKEMCETLFHCLAGTVTVPAALAQLGNRSFSTGLDCSLHPEFQYFDCIFEQAGKEKSCR